MGLVSAAVGSATVFAQKATTGIGDVDDPGDVASVVDDGQLTNAAGEHKLGSLPSAGVSGNDGRFGLHYLPDANLVDVLAVGHDVGNIGGGNDPGDSARTWH